MHIHNVDIDKDCEAVPPSLDIRILVSGFEFNEDFVVPSNERAKEAVELLLGLNSNSRVTANPS